MVTGACGVCNGLPLANSSRHRLRLPVTISMLAAYRPSRSNRTSVASRSLSATSMICPTCASGRRSSWLCVTTGLSLRASTSCSGTFASRICCTEPARPAGPALWRSSAHHTCRGRIQLLSASISRSRGNPEALLVVHSDPFVSSRGPRGPGYCHSYSRACEHCFGFGSIALRYGFDPLFPAKEGDDSTSVKRDDCTIAGQEDFTGFKTV